MNDINRLIIYRDFDQDEILEDFFEFIEDDMDDENMFFDCVNRLIKLAAKRGFTGDIWHVFITYLLANHVNPYSLACEKKGDPDGSIKELAKHDFKIIRSIFNFDFSELKKKFPSKLFDVMFNYKGLHEKAVIFNENIRDNIVELSIKLSEAQSDIKFMNLVTDFYKKFGVGEVGLHKAFRIGEDDECEPCIVPITNIPAVHLDDIVGYDLQKKQLTENTESFLNGYKANNCLLYGDAGTGKSTSIKAIANEYYDRGLRIIEVYKHEFELLPAIISIIKNRNYRFIIYMDDLSFEEFETEYKYLKAVIEGGLENKPENVLIYATSNRRHLIKEKFTDKNDYDDELHSSDTVQEKISLATRFGVQIYYGVPPKKEFDNIVLELAKKRNIKVSEEELLAEANKWSVRHASTSGRCAEQFIDHFSAMSESK